MKGKFIAPFLVTVLLTGSALGQSPDRPSGRVENNVVLGMYSGLALLMDVHYPERPNGFGVVYVSGSGWTAPLTYAAAALKSNEQSLMYAKPLVAAGYTVFTINHRSAPRFRYPAAVEDVQRAVRFVRHHAQQFGIRADRIGAAGGSSGGHLVSLLGALDGKGDPADPDPVNRESAKVQCVIARAAPVDFFTMAGAGVPLAVNFLGMTGGVGTAAEPLTSIEKKTSREASPMYYVSADDPPFLLIHGDADATVPFSQSEKMEKVLKDAGVPARLLRISGGGHGPTFTGATNPPDYLGEMVRWFDRYLKDGTAAR